MQICRQAMLLALSYDGFDGVIEFIGDILITIPKMLVNNHSHNLLRELVCFQLLC